MSSGIAAISANSPPRSTTAPRASMLAWTLSRYLAVLRRLRSSARGSVSENAAATLSSATLCIWRLDFIWRQRSSGEELIPGITRASTHPLRMTASTTWPNTWTGSSSSSSSRSSRAAPSSLPEGTRYLMREIIKRSSEAISGKHTGDQTAMRYLDALGLPSTRTGTCPMKTMGTCRCSSPGGG